LRRLATVATIEKAGGKIKTDAVVGRGFRPDRVGLNPRPYKAKNESKNKRKRKRQSKTAKQNHQQNQRPQVSRAKNARPDLSCKVRNGARPMAVLVA